MDPEEFRKRLLEIKNRENTKLVEEKKVTQPIPQKLEETYQPPRIIQTQEKILSNPASNQGQRVDDNFSLAKKPEGLSHEGGLRTIATDMARAVREQELSVIKIALAEQKKREAIEEYNAPTSKKNLSYIFGSLIFIALAGGVIWYFYLKPSSDEEKT